MIKITKSTDGPYPTGIKFVYVNTSFGIKNSYYQNVYLYQGKDCSWYEAKSGKIRIQ